MPYQAFPHRSDGIVSAHLLVGTVSRTTGTDGGVRTCGMSGGVVDVLDVYIVSNRQDIGG